MIELIAAAQSQCLSYGIRIVNRARIITDENGGKCWKYYDTVGRFWTKAFCTEQRTFRIALHSTHNSSPGYYCWTKYDIADLITDFPFQFSAWAILNLDRVLSKVEEPSLSALHAEVCKKCNLKLHATTTIFAMINHNDYLLQLIATIIDTINSNNWL